MAATRRSLSRLSQRLRGGGGAAAYQSFPEGGSAGANGGAGGSRTRSQIRDVSAEHTQAKLCRVCLIGGKSVLSILANPENLRQASLIGVAERLSSRPLQRPLLASLASAARPRRRNETFYDSAGAQQMGAYRRGSLRRLKFKSAPHKKSRRRKSKPVRQRRR